MKAFFAYAIMGCCILNAHVTAFTVFKLYNETYATIKVRFQLEKKDGSKRSTRLEYNLPQPPKTNFSHFQSTSIFAAQFFSQPIFPEETINLSTIVLYNLILEFSYHGCVFFLKKIDVVDLLNVNQITYFVRLNNSDNFKVFVEKSSTALIVGDALNKLLFELNLPPVN